MGLDTTRRAEEEDLAYEDALEDDGRKGIEGCNSTEQVLCVWTCEEGAFIMPVLRCRYGSKSMFSNIFIN